nr:MAG TPA: hypothetical protein [Caudoviricetes sp.]
MDFISHLFSKLSFHLLYICSCPIINSTLRSPSLE